jgi:hypothetical protein
MNVSMDVDPEERAIEFNQFFTAAMDECLQAVTLNCS